jgi:hypothetical protein
MAREHWPGFRMGIRRGSRRVPAAPPSCPAEGPVVAEIAPAEAPGPAEGAGWDHFQSRFPGPRKLTFDQAEEIRRRRREGATRPELAREYGVSIGTIDGVLAGRVYRSPD